MAQLTRFSSSLRMGIVGMANVGKSSTFNILSKQSVPAENYPFCTIDPNVAVVKVPDPRFDYLCKVFKPKSQIASTLQITDIAGLVKGASEGYGLGNEFLGHISAVDGLYQVVRAFKEETIVHTEGEMDPIRDLQIISEELVAKDYAFVSKRLEELSRKIKKYEASKNVSQEARDMIVQHQVLQKSEKALSKKAWIRYEKWNEQEVKELRKLQLLTSKPSIYLININHKDEQLTNQIKKWISTNSSDSKVIFYSAQQTDDQKLFDSIITAGYDLLGLIRYFTVGSDEVRSWTIKKNTKAPQAASAIHSDFERGFISAEVMSFEKFQKLGDDALSIYQKKFAKEGKEYIVKDGDIVHFKCKK